MKLPRLGRPSLDPYADRFDVPAADGPMSVTFLGVATLLLEEPLRALPYLGDDLDATMRVLVPLAEEDGVSLHFPTVWAREDPWASESPPVVE